MESTPSSLIATRSALDIREFKLDLLLLLEYLKVLIWPLITISSIIYFRENIALFINRISSIKGPGGTEIRTEEQKRAQEDGVSEIPEKEIENLIKPQIDQVKQKYEKELDKNKKTLGYLLEEISIRNLMIDYERIYNLIFGSQISLLRNLQAKGTVGDTRHELERFFSIVRIIWQPSFQNWSLDQYLHFLITNRLIETTPEGNCRITDKARFFLSYVSSLGYPENKTL